MYHVKVFNEKGRLMSQHKTTASPTPAQASILTCGHEKWWIDVSRITNDVLEYERERAYEFCD